MRDPLATWFAMNSDRAKTPIRPSLFPPPSTKSLFPSLLNSGWSDKKTKLTRRKGFFNWNCRSWPPNTARLINRSSLQREGFLKSEWFLFDESLTATKDNLLEDKNGRKGKEKENGERDGIRLSLPSGGCVPRHNSGPPGKCWHPGHKTCRIAWNSDCFDHRLLLMQGGKERFYTCKRSRTV